MSKFLDSGRSWPQPAGSWVMNMDWLDLLFMHYQVDVDQLRSLVPAGLEIDTFEGTAWVGVVPFRMERVAPRFMPPIPGLSSFPELNVRTYVTCQGKPGVWFFSLDATNRLAVRAARALFYLNYLDAKISLRHLDPGLADGWIEYKSRRTHRDSFAAELDCRYRARGPAFSAAAGSLEEFLTARYCLYAANPRGMIYRGEVDHPSWQLQQAEAVVTKNTMLDSHGIQPLPGEPLLHFAKKVPTRAWMIKPVG